MSANGNPPKSVWRDPTVIAAFIGAAGLLLGFYLQYGPFRSSDSADSAKPQSTSVPSPTATSLSHPDDSGLPTFSTPPTKSPTSVGKTSAPPPPPEPTQAPKETTPGSSFTAKVRYLTDIGPIGGYGNFTKKGSTQLGDEVLSESIIFSPGVFNKDVNPLTFNAPSDLKAFKATVGLSQDSLPGYVAYVDITRRDGSRVVGLTLHPGEAFKVSENVANAGALTVKVSILEWAPNAINSRPHIVVGDGRFV